MALITIESSAISAVEYHKKNQQLDIHFTDGDFREYLKVPEKVYEELINASSAGAYFNYAIRDFYSWRK